MGEGYARCSCGMGQDEIAQGLMPNLFQHAHLAYRSALAETRSVW